MALEDIERIVEQSSNKLYQISSPPVRYWLLTQVMGKDERDAVLKDTLRQCESYLPKVKLLAKLRSDGTWPIPKQKKIAEDAGPGPPVGWTYRTILWNLFTLAEYRASRDEGHVGKALSNLLRWQTAEGYIPGPWTDAFPLPYFTAHALHVLLRFGLERDKRVSRMTDWLLSMQRSDGGWNIPYLQDLHYLPDYRWMKVWQFIEFVKKTDKSAFNLSLHRDTPSCHWSTMLVVWALAESPKHERSQAVRQGAEFFLNRFFKKNYHTSFYMTEKHWTTLKYPARFGNGLMGLDILTRLGYGPDDPRMEKPIAWLVGARSPDGFWSQSMRPHPERDQWITLIALRTLARYSRM